MSDVMSWRIQIQEDAANVTVTPTPLSTGAMVIRSPKGNAEPYKLTKGNTADLYRLFGYPSATYPDIQDAEDFLKDSDLWVSAPSDTTDALYGGILATKAGSVALTQGIPDKDLFSFSAVPWKEEIGTGDAVETNFVYVLTGLNYVNTSISKIIIGTTEIDVSATDAEPEVLSGTGITTGTLTRATKTLDVTFDTAPALGDSIKVIYDVDYSQDAYYALFSSSQLVNDESVLTTYNTDIDQFEFDFYIKDFRGVDRKVSSYYASNIPSTFNASNVNIFIEDFLDDVPYFTPKANTTLVYSTFTDDTSLVAWGGGVREVSSFTSTEFAEGWEFFNRLIAEPESLLRSGSHSPGLSFQPLV